MQGDRRKQRTEAMGTLHVLRQYGRVPSSLRGMRAGTKQRSSFLAHRTTVFWTIEEYSSAFRDMLSMSTGLNDGTVPLPETGADVALFLKAISGDGGNADEGCPMISKTAWSLFKLVMKYVICIASNGGLCLFLRIISKRILWCFAVAYPCSPVAVHSA